MSALRRAVVATSCALGCGPEASVVGSSSVGAESTTTASTSAADSAASTSRGADTTSATTTGPSTSGSSTATSTSSTTADSACDAVEDDDDDTCCQGCDIGPDDLVDEGFSAADVLAVAPAQLESLPIEWLTEPTSTTAASIAIVEVTRIRDVPGPPSCCPCMFIYFPCPGGIAIEGTFEISTGDGYLEQMQASGTLAIGSIEPDPLRGSLSTSAVDVTDSVGTLGQATFFDANGEPCTPTWVVAEATFGWADPREVATLQLWSDCGSIGLPAAPTDTTGQ